MLATLIAQAFRKPGWVFEEKYDGDRILAYKEGHRVRLLSRNGKDRTERFPRIDVHTDFHVIACSGGQHNRRIPELAHLLPPTPMVL